MTDATLRELDADVATLTSPTTAQLRAVRRAHSTALKSRPAREIIALAEQLVDRDRDFDRFFAYEFIAAHPNARSSLGATVLRRLGRGMDSWVDVDTFASYVAGPAWREGLVPDGEITRWAQSADRWWRRAAVVSTVPLNCQARGGRGDASRTLAICALVIDDRDPMVVKALSWALRELAKREPDAVEHFIAAHAPDLAPLVLREVKSKLSTGLKAPRKRAHA